ncbi:MAG: hypothetical protein KAT71_00715 [Gammaproteobacteria bacterium]|nr:hypothetical protein [Gammaproteobacteria bacterium]
MLGETELIEAAKIFFKFPKEVILHETEWLVDVVCEIARQGNVDAKEIIKSLIDRNPTKYWDLKHYK